MNNLGPDAVERELARIANQHPEHREVLDRAATMILRMAATIALIKAATAKGRSE